MDEKLKKPLVENGRNGSEDSPGYGGVNPPTAPDKAAPNGKPTKKKQISRKSYASKKSNVHNLSNLTLLTSNINQLRTVLSMGRNGTEYFTLNMTLLSCSIGLSVAVTLLLLAVSQQESHKSKHDKESEANPDKLKPKKKLGTSKSEHRSNILTNIIGAIAFVIIVLNIAITAFSESGIHSNKTTTPSLNISKS